MAERIRRPLLAIAALLGVVALIVAMGRTCTQQRQVINLAVADALAVPIGRAVEIFERENDGVSINLVAEGSVMLLRMQLLHPADVVMLADARLIEDVLRPSDVDWLIKFATTEIVVARTQASRHAEQITEANWAEILGRPDTAVSHPDPATDSCGYYTRLAWRLAELHGFPGLYDKMVAKSLPALQRPDALGVLALLESRAADYAFVYRCHAEQHHLAFVRLPEVIGLGRTELANSYAAAEIEVPDFKGGVIRMKGHPIHFGLAISKHTRRQALAEQFIRLVLSDRGRALLQSSGIQPTEPALAPSWSIGLPRSVADLVQVEVTTGNKQDSL